jgi:hypothetical protein
MVGVVIRCYFEAEHPQNGEFLVRAYLEALCTHFTIILRLAILDFDIAMPRSPVLEGRLPDRRSFSRKQQDRGKVGKSRSRLENGHLEATRNYGSS